MLRGASQAMNIKVVDSQKGRYFYYHILPAIRNMGVDLQAELVPLEKLEEMEEQGLVLGDQVHENSFGAGFVAIDGFLHESVSFSFSQDDVVNLLAELGCEALCPWALYLGRTGLSAKGPRANQLTLLE